MRIEVLWEEDSKTFLKKLDKKEASRIIKKVKEISLNYEKHIFALINKNFFKIRIGSYRLFVDLEKNKLIIRTIKHRKNTYKK